MIKITSVSFVYDQEGNLKEYNISFDGRSDIVQMLAGNIRINADEMNLGNIQQIVQEKLRSTLETGG